MLLKDIAPHVLVSTPQAPEPLVRSMLMLTANDFCQSSLAWSHYTGPVPLADNQRAYPVTTPADSKPYIVREVWMGARRLVFKTIPQLAAIIGDWQGVRSTDPLYFNSVDARGSVSVFPTPLNASLPITIRVALVPDMVANNLPDFLTDIYLDALTGGAKARIMAIPNQPYSNPELVAFHQAQFDEGVSTAIAEREHEGAVGSLYVQPRAFGF